MKNTTVLILIGIAIQIQILVLVKHLAEIVQLLEELKVGQ